MSNGEDHVKVLVVKRARYNAGVGAILMRNREDHSVPLTKSIMPQPACRGICTKQVVLKRAMFYINTNFAQTNVSNSKPKERSARIN